MIFIISLGLFSSQSWAADCKIMEGNWEGISGSKDIPKYLVKFTVLIQNGKMTIQNLIFIIDGSQDGPHNINAKCSRNGNQVKMILNFPQVIDTEILNLSQDYMSYEGTWSNTGGSEGFTSMKRISALPDTTSTHEDARSCVVKKDSSTNPTYTLQNICKDAINLKYTFTRSKPFAGTYVTLQPNQETFETANKDEKYKFMACIFPEVPSAINGKCK